MSRSRSARVLRFCLALASLGALAACDEATGGEDAGPGADAGDPDAGEADAGEADTGPIGMPEAGPVDAGPGPGEDGGVDLDGGMDLDGGVDLDGGMDLDGGGPLPDAGVDAGGPMGVCPDSDLGMAVGAAVATGTNVGAGNAAVGSCASGRGGEDVGFTWTAPSDGIWTFDTRGSEYDTVLHVWAGSACSGTELACDDDSGGGGASEASLALIAGDAVTIVLDAFAGTDSGGYVLNITPPETPVTCPEADLGSALGAAVATGSNAGATNDATSSCGAGGAGTDAAYRWTAPAPGDYIFDTDGSDYDTVLHVREGAACDGAELGCNDDVGGGPLHSTLTLTLTGGQEVTIVVDAYNASSGDYVLNIERVASCPDGDLGSAEGPAVAMGSTTGAVNDATGTCGAGAAGEDVAFTWTAPRAGAWTFDTAGSSFDTVLHAREGAMCDGAQLGCDDDGGPGLQSSLTVDVAESEQITIVVDGYNMANGDFVLNVTGPPVVIPGCITGDLGAAVGAAVATGTNAGSGDEVQPGCTASAGEEVAYTWTAPADGIFVFDTFGSDYDTVLHVQEGETCAGAELGCDDDSGTGAQSEVRLSLGAGERLTLLLDAAADATGAYVLNIAQLPACPNADLGSAEGPAAAMGSTAGERNSATASCGGGAPAPDVGLRWTAPRAGTWTFDTFGSGFDTVLHLRSGLTCDGVELGCNDDAAGVGPSELAVSLVAGQQIVIVVDGFGASNGSYVLNITPPP